MSWKAYAAVSGATVLAGWVVSAPSPSGIPAPGTTGPSRATQTMVTPSSDIEREAGRLEARMRRETAYAQPRRDPFRFGAAAERVTALADPVGEQAGTGPPGDTGAPVAVSASEPAPVVSLAGIAEDQIDDLSGQRVERTAVLSSPDGVLLVREGDDVLGLYRVVTIDSDAVELERHDGTTLRLGFRP
jgi:hypothetical protein